MLREQVVRESKRERAFSMEIVNDCVVVRVILEASACINDTSDPEPIQLAHEQSC